MVDINIYNFEEEVLACNSDVFLIFSSAKCSYCRDLKRLVQILQRVLTDVKFCCVDVDAEKNLAARFSVTRLPTSVVFYKGEVKARAEGALTKAEVYSLLQRSPESIKS